MKFKKSSINELAKIDAFVIEKFVNISDEDVISDEKPQYRVCAIMLDGSRVKLPETFDSRVKARKYVTDLIADCKLKIVMHLPDSTAVAKALDDYVKKYRELLNS